MTTERTFTENVPNVPNTRIVGKEGDITTEWRIFFEALRDSITFIKNTLVITTDGNITQLIDVRGIASTDLVIAQMQFGAAGVFVEKARALTPTPTIAQVEITYSVAPPVDLRVSVIVIAPKLDNKFIG